MGKTKRIKVDFDDTSEILEMVLIMKDIATNLFFRSAKRKQILIDFIYYFTDFFRMVNFVGTHHPLVDPPASTAAVLAVTSESAFMGDMNTRMMRTALAEAEKNGANEFIIIGNKVGDKMKTLYGKTKTIHTIGEINKNGIYKISIMAKDYVIQRILDGKIGKLIAVYPFSININLIKPKTAVLFPSKDFFLEQQEKLKKEEIIEKVITESDKNEVIGYLASVWLTCRVYELLMNAETSGYAAQVQQLEAASDRLKKEKLILGMQWRKSRKADISKGISEVYSASMVGKH